MCFIGTRKCAPLIAKEGRFQQGLGNGGAVNRDIRFICSWRLQMNLPRKYIFAHAALTSEQHGGVRSSYALAARKNAQGLGGFRNDGLTVAVACGQGNGLVAGNHAYEMLGLKGFD